MSHKLFFVSVYEISWEPAERHLYSNLFVLFQSKMCSFTWLDYSFTSLTDRYVTLQHFPLVFCLSLFIAEKQWVKFFIPHERKMTQKKQITQRKVATHTHTHTRSVGALGVSVVTDTHQHHWSKSDMLWLDQPLRCTIPITVTQTKAHIHITPNTPTLYTHCYQHAIQSTQTYTVIHIIHDIEV